MEARLVVVGGKSSRDSVALRLPAVIGRGREAQVTVAHPMVSRRHCELFERAGLLVVRDLGSLNGTLVQGRRVMEAPLRPSDEFTVGPLTFRVEYECPRDQESGWPPPAESHPTILAPPSSAPSVDHLEQVEELAEPEIVELRESPPWSDPEPSPPSP